MLVFGGKSNTYSNELFSYSITNNFWKPEKTSGDVPSKRYGHSKVIYNDEIFLFGGYDIDSFSCKIKI